MRVTSVRSEGLAALSYFVSSEGTAFVVDPRRDVSVYCDLAQTESVDIHYIFETHRNEDYVTGSLELKAMFPEAEVCHSEATAFGFGDHSVADHESFKVGGVSIECISTPGHTDDSMCYAVADLSVGSDPILVFTGDTLFVNEVGRTDLVDKKKHAEMSSKLFDSLHSKVLPLGAGVIVHPGHGAGSVCGGEIGEREFTTIGYETRHNQWLKMSESEFVEKKLNQDLTHAPYFKHCEHLNAVGPPILSESRPPVPLSAERLADLLQEEDHIVVDTRVPADFLDSHVPGAISLSLSNMGLLAGWVLDPTQSHSFVLDSDDNISKARAYLIRVGIDGMVGYLSGGFSSWKDSGRATSSMRALSVDDVRSGIRERKLLVLDTREPHEYSEGHIKGSISVPLTAMRTAEVPGFSGMPVVAVCPSGFRSTSAGSVLGLRGIQDVGVMVDGLKAWTSRGYDLSSGE
jgi:hydroxyacylglutathione hydrolase